MKIWKYYVDGQSVDLKTFFEELSKVTITPMCSLEYLRNHQGSTRFKMNPITRKLHGFMVERTLYVELKGI